MARPILNSDSLPKAGRVNEVCREWLVYEDGALAYRLQDKEIKEHYSGNKIRNAQVREDLPRAKVEQQLEEFKYQSRVQQQEENDALIARQVALKLEKEEKIRERKLKESMKYQLKRDHQKIPIEIELEMQRRLQEQKDEIIQTDEIVLTAERLFLEVVRDIICRGGAHQYFDTSNTQLYSSKCAVSELLSLVLNK